MILERFFKRPLDIEWTIDAEGKMWILQARPLGLTHGSRPRSLELKNLLRHYPAVMKDLGTITYRGIGAGPVWLAKEGADLDDFPAGAVLVSRYSLPVLARVIPRASAVITDVGSPTGHMATIAREFRIPTIVDTGSATESLKPGQLVTVDAERNVVYEGRIKELLHHQLLERASFETTYEFQLLRRMLKRIAPLTLIDPEDANFTPAGCRTLHDVLRFMHEKSVEALVRVAQDPRTLLKHGGRRLKANLPLNLILIDIGGGLADNLGKTDWVKPEQIKSQAHAGPLGRHVFTGCLEYRSYCSGFQRLALQLDANADHGASGAYSNGFERRCFECELSESDFARRVPFYRGRRRPLAIF